jgi:hypothetical protein
VLEVIPVGSKYQLVTKTAGHQGWKFIYDLQESQVVEYNTAELELGRYRTMLLNPYDYGIIFPEVKVKAKLYFKENREIQDIRIRKNVLWP